MGQRISQNSVATGGGSTGINITQAQGLINAGRNSVTVVRPDNTPVGASPLVGDITFGTPTAGDTVIYVYDDFSKDIFSYNGAGWDLKNVPAQAGAESIWSKGSGAPVGAPPADKEFYLNTINGDEYKASVDNLSWVLQEDASASIWLTGSGAPTGVPPTDKQFYLDTDTGDEYKKNVAGTAWVIDIPTAWDFSLVSDPTGTAPKPGYVAAIYAGNIYYKDNATGLYVRFSISDVDSRDMFLNRNAPVLTTDIPPEVAVLTDNDLQDTIEVVFNDFIVYYITNDGDNWVETDRQDRSAVVDPVLFSGTAAELLLLDATANVETPTNAQIKLLADSKNTPAGSPFHYSSGFPVTLRYATVSDGAVGVNVIRRTAMIPEYYGASDLELPDETTFDVDSQFFWNDTATFERSRYFIDANNELNKFVETGSAGGSSGGIDATTMNAAIVNAIASENIFDKAEAKSVFDLLLVQKLAEGFKSTTEVDAYEAQRTAVGV